MMVSSLLAQISFPAILDMIAKILDRIGDERATKAAETVKEVEHILRREDVPAQQRQALDAQFSALLKERLEHDARRLEAVNSSLRAEVASEDVYVRRMRPTFGYLMAVTWAAQMLAVAYLLVFQTNKAALVIESVESLGTIWAVALSVLGIYVYKRSEDKKRLL